MDELRSNRLGRPEENAFKQDASDRSMLLDNPGRMDEVPTMLSVTKSLHPDWKDWTDQCFWTILEGSSDSAPSEHFLFLDCTVGLVCSFLSGCNLFGTPKMDGTSSFHVEVRLRSSGKLTLPGLSSSIERSDTSYLDAISSNAQDGWNFILPHGKSDSAPAENFLFQECPVALICLLLPIWMQSLRTPNIDGTSIDRFLWEF
ncbi:unnamed protein product [Orchesella dallaii]|uniref:Uncharacterized protein n=1 Tax=Orchesella dallaii TaxID=48710 RepID=A0ABP1R5E5_9HEXA